MWIGKHRASSERVARSGSAPVSASVSGEPASWRASVCVCVFSSDSITVIAIIMFVVQCSPPRRKLAGHSLVHLCPGAGRITQPADGIRSDRRAAAERANPACARVDNDKVTLLRTQPSSVLRRSCNFVVVALCRRRAAAATFAANQPIHDFAMTKLNCRADARALTISIISLRLSRPIELRATAQSTDSCQVYLLPGELRRAKNGCWPAGGHFPGLARVRSSG